MIESSRNSHAAHVAGRDQLHAHVARPAGHGAAPSLVPIRSLGVGHRERIATHLLDLDERDRYLRFGYNAADRHIQDYVASLNFEKDDIFGIYNRKLELIAMAHLAYSVNPQFKSCAEFGVSVRSKARGRGFGARLFERATIHARNEGVELLFVHALSENTAMLKIARKAGAVVERDGSEAEAFLRLPEATLDSRMTEMVAEQLAQTDYQLKTQAKHFWDLLDGLQNIRQGVREARHKSAM
ncbi:GNAT family N-acetyltransferase [Rhodoferax sp.]|uniref:GNAT family N-acetyltransferase n=1 Tax=Rhodoferax sp. TaxID=50421 RepID=UPI00374CDF4E